MLIFLDIDGVLNSTGFCQRCYLANIDMNDWIDPVNVAALNRLVSGFNAQLVISSAWRLGFFHNLSGLQNLLRKHNIFPIIGMTGYRNDADRAQEIRDYLDKLDQDFLILDDMDLDGFGDKFIRTDPITGLTDDLVDSILARKPYA